MKYPPGGEPPPPKYDTVGHQNPNFGYGNSSYQEAPTATYIVSLYRALTFRVSPTSNDLNLTSK